MNKMPLLSVIVPIYNVEAYLPECIESILNQSYSNLEIILVDDGAKGQEPIICDSYALKDGRIKVIHKKNAGLVAARKTGVDNAHGQFITFVDGDDYLAPNYYEQLMHLQLIHSADLVCCGYTYITSELSTPTIQKIESGVYSGNTLHYLWHNMVCFNEKYFSFGVFPSTCMKIYKTDLLKETICSIPTEIHLGEDFALTFPYILKCNTIVVDNSNVGYMYRYIADSMSNQRNIGLFTESSTLYDYIKPFFYNTNDEKIINQLEYYRAYLIQLALIRWEYQIPLVKAISLTNQIREYSKNCALFSNLDIICALSIPNNIKRRIKWINKNAWIFYKLHMIIVSFFYYIRKRQNVRTPKPTFLY